MSGEANVHPWTREMRVLLLCLVTRVSGAVGQVCWGNAGVEGRSRGVKEYPQC